MKRRNSTISSLAAAVATVSVILLSGCMTEDGDGRHMRPLPARLVALMSEKGMSQADPIFIRIFKKESELEVWKRLRSGEFALLKTYPMCRWSGQLGPKKKEGDRQAPEGFYSVTPALMNPRSEYYLSFNLGYPNALEKSQGFTGSALMVHGACTSAGCFAMTDDGVAEIYGLAREAFAGGQESFQVQALPFRMNAENMVRHGGGANSAFWRNLKEGSDHFEATKRPPVIASCGGRYVFNVKSSGATLDPSYPCPAMEIEPSASKAVALKGEQDAAEIARLSKAGSLAVNYALLDGGMHWSFRDMMKTMGPERMQSMVSGRLEISRPAAALADQYRN